MSCSTIPAGGRILVVEDEPTRRVDILISKIRAKLSRPGQPAPIRSVWGVGYRFET